MIIGLTGPSGSGKSYVSKLFFQKGFYIIDLDTISREVCRKDSECLREIVSEFSNDILLENGELDRHALGKIVFSNHKELVKLNNITHKYILNRTFDIISKNSDKNIVLDAPLLIETELDKKCDIVISVFADRIKCVKRIMERDKVSETDALNRLNMQHENEFYTQKSDYVIENNLGISELIENTNVVIKSILAEE